MDTTPGAGNLISGNLSDGILVNPEIGSGNAILGNLIGTDVTGSVAMPNQGHGVHIQGNGVTVGGPLPGAGNVISGNLGDGVFLDGASSNVVQGNFVGTDASGIRPLGNGINGVSATFGFASDLSATNNTIGGTGAGAGNIIAFNSNIGVKIGESSFDSSTGNAILSNSIFANGALGIDLGADGVTPNTPGGVIGARTTTNPTPGCWIS